MSTAAPWNSAMPRIVLALVLLLAAAGNSLAQTTVERIQVERTQVERLAEERARQWGLTVEEWQRYETLKHGIAGAIGQPNLSPLEVLGIHARDEAERRRYAELLARQMRAYTQQVIAFQQAYDQEMEKAFADQPGGAAFTHPRRSPAARRCSPPVTG